MNATETGIDLSVLIRSATEVIESARYCWMATADASGAARARPMGRLPCDLDEDQWIFRFLSDARSRKAAEIRHSHCATVVFQKDEDAFVSVMGAAALTVDAVELTRRWRSAYDVYFPTEGDRVNAILVEVRARQMELWIRGATGAPFGLWPAILVRGAAGQWDSIPYEHG
jgi:general stress protein 26